RTRRAGPCTVFSRAEDGIRDFHVTGVQTCALPISSISDKSDAIQEALRHAEARADVVIMTGGLGPTRDDITKATVAAYFGTTLVRDEAVLAHVEAIFHRKAGRVMPAMNKGQ